MNPYAVFKFKFSFDVWQPVINAQQQTVFQFRRRGLGIVSPGATQTYLFSKDAIPVGSILREVEDPKGVKVFYEQGFDMDRYIIASEPTFDVWGNVDGYKHTINRNAPLVYRGVNT